MADPENFGGGGFEAQNLKNSDVFTKIQSDFSAEIGNSNVFFAQIQVVSKKNKKKKKVFTKTETDFSPDSLRLGRWGGMHPEMEPNYSKQRLIFRPNSLLLGWWGGCIPPIPPPKSATESHVSISWIPGHAVVHGNEVADYVAKSGSKSKIHGPEPFITVPNASYVITVKDWSTDRWKSMWNERKECFRMKESVGWTSSRLTIRLLNPKRPQLNRVVQVLTGHCSLQRHKKTTGRAESKW